MKERVRGMVTRMNFLIVCITVLNITTGAFGAEDFKIPEYIGSQACLGCHVDTYSVWKSSNHANMVVPIINATNLPLDIEQASAGLQEELRKAEYMVANSFFIARDPSTQHYKMLRVIYDRAAKTYNPSDLTLDWSTQCAGCHTTNMNTPNLTWGESGIG